MVNVLEKGFYFYGVKSLYNAEEHGHGLYFCTDTKEIIKNGVPYGGKVDSVALSEDGTAIVVTYLDGTTETIEVGSGSYASNIEDKSVAMTTKYGDYGVGTTVADLEGKSYDELFDGILFPTINPSHGNPSLTGFALSPSTSPVEVGTAVASVSNAGLNKATWTTYNNGLAYAGDITSTVYTFVLNGTTYSGTDAQPTGLPTTWATVGNQTYKAVVNYGKGATPVNNKGVEVESLACPAGSVNATRTINVTLPWFASTSAATAENPVVKQTLISWNGTAGAMSTGNFVVQPSGTLPQVFKLPRKLSSLQMLNTVSGKMETTSTTVFTETTETLTINGTEQTYYVYTYNGATRGSVTLLAKF